MFLESLANLPALAGYVPRQGKRDFEVYSVIAAQCDEALDLIQAGTINASTGNTGLNSGGIFSAFSMKACHVSIMICLL